MFFNGRIPVMVFCGYLSQNGFKSAFNPFIIRFKVFPSRTFCQQFNGQSMVVGQLHDFSYHFRVRFVSIIIMIKHRHTTLFPQRLQFMPIKMLQFLQSGSQQYGCVFPSRQVSQILVIFRALVGVIIHIVNDKQFLFSIVVQVIHHGSPRVILIPIILNAIQETVPQILFVFNPCYLVKLGFKLVKQHLG